MSGKSEDLVRNFILETSQDHKRYQGDGQTNRNTRHCNPVDSAGEASCTFKADSFGNEIGKVQ